MLVVSSIFTAFVELFIYLLFCYICTAISRTFLFVTDTGQLLQKWNDVLDYLYNKSDGKMNIWKVLYKAGGGCDACNAMWFSIILYPVYLYAGSKFGFATLPLNDMFLFFVFWLLAPFITFDILTLKNK